MPLAMLIITGFGSVVMVVSAHISTLQD